MLFCLILFIAFIKLIWNIICLTWWMLLMEEKDTTDFYFHRYSIVFYFRFKSLTDHSFDVSTLIFLELFYYLDIQYQAVGIHINSNWKPSLFISTRNIVGLFVHRESNFSFCLSIFLSVFPCLIELLMVRVKT